MWLATAVWSLVCVLAGCDNAAAALPQVSALAPSSVSNIDRAGFVRDVVGPAMTAVQSSVVAPLFVALWWGWARWWEAADATRAPPTGGPELSMMRRAGAPGNPLWGGKMLQAWGALLSSPEAVTLVVTHLQVVFEVLDVETERKFQRLRNNCAAAAAQLSAGRADLYHLVADPCASVDGWLEATVENAKGVAVLVSPGGRNFTNVPAKVFHGATSVDALVLSPRKGTAAGTVTPAAAAEVTMRCTVTHVLSLRTSTHLSVEVGVDDRNVAVLHIDVNRVRASVEVVAQLVELAWSKQAAVDALDDAAKHKLLTVLALYGIVAMPSPTFLCVGRHGLLRQQRLRREHDSRARGWDTRKRGGRR